MPKAPRDSTLYSLRSYMSHNQDLNDHQMQSLRLGLDQSQVT